MTSTTYSPKATEISDLPSEIIATHILNRIDGRTLASTALVSPWFRALSNQENLWTQMCNSTWPSTNHPLIQNTVSTFPGGHRSLFSDSSSVIHFDNTKNRHKNIPTRTAEQLISAVDIQYKNTIVYSKVDMVNSGNEKFLNSTFKIEVLDEKECVMFPMQSQDDEKMYLSDLKENMTLSWILIDPTHKQAANISSQQPVSVRPHWIDGDIEVKYAITVPDYRGRTELMEIRITVMLEWGEGRRFLKLRKVKLQVQDMDSMCLEGKESLRILSKATENGRGRKGKKGEETERYSEYVEMKRLRRDGKHWRRRSNTTPLLISTIFLGLIIPVVLGFATVW